MRSVLLHTVSDALASAGVAVVGGIIYLTHGPYWLDPVAAIGIGLVIGAGPSGSSATSYGNWATPITRARLKRGGQHQEQDQEDERQSRQARCRDHLGL